MCNITGSHFSSLLTILNGKVGFAQCSLKVDSVLHAENNNDLYRVYRVSAINVKLVYCRCHDHPGLGKFVRGSDVEIESKISSFYFEHFVVLKLKFTQYPAIHTNYSL